MMMMNAKWFFRSETNECFRELQKRRWMGRSKYISSQLLIVGTKEMVSEARIRLIFFVLANKAKVRQRK